MQALLARFRVGTRTIAGFTQIYRNPAHPELLDQGDTGVFPQFRNRGIGRWLKAAMLEEVLRHYPEARRIARAAWTANVSRAESPEPACRSHVSSRP